MQRLYIQTYEKVLPFSLEDLEEDEDPHFYVVMSHDDPFTSYVYGTREEAVKAIQKIQNTIQKDR